MVLIDELKNAGGRLPLLSLDSRTRAPFGFDISKALGEMGVRNQRESGVKPRRRSVV
jgi:hypothetical protein